MLLFGNQFLIILFKITFKDSKLDITIGPYETYEDAIFGYKVNKLKFPCVLLTEV